jgi:acyl-CoA synthetase (NDP forming)
MTRLDRLFRPASIAVVGGSWGRSVIEQLQRINYQGDIWPVHPTHTELFGLRCYASVDALPAAPDACFIGVNRHATLDVVAALAARGSGGAVCFASGFSEATAEDAGAGELQQALLERAGSMPIIGPNCYGFINYLDGALLWPDLHGGARVDSGVAVVTQSSNIAISLTMQRRSLPIAYVLTAGNQAQISIAELGMAALQDERVTALGMHIEGFGDIRAMEALATKAAELGKGIVVIKAGRSQQSRQAMVSHTNSLSGSDASSDALLKRLGIARVNSLPVLLESLKLLHVYGRLDGNSVASMSCSGGEAGLMADAILGRQLVYKPMDDHKAKALREVLGPMVAIANPLDYHTYIWNDQPAMAATFAAMLNDAADLSFLVIDFPRVDLPGGESWDVAVDALIEAKRQTGAAVAILATLPENVPDAVSAKLLKEGIASLYGIDEAMDATAAVASIAALPVHAMPVVLSQGDSAESQSLVLTEHEAKERLQQAGLAVPGSAVVGDVDQAIATAQRIGYPVVAKLVGEAHKTELNGVELNIADDAALKAATSRLFALSDTILVESYCDGAVAELLVGIVREESGLLMLTVGAGGVYTELLRDTRSVLLPATAEDIKSVLQELNVAALLNGYRNKPAADLHAIIKQVTRLCEWAVDHVDELQEVEINPLLCLSDTAVVADALIRLRQPV